MKPFLRFPILLLLGLALGAGLASAAENRLAVRVDVPPTWRPFLADDIAEAFATRVRETFERRGFEGRLDYVAPADTAPEGVPLLAINLMEWRLDRIGNVTCTLTAVLEAGSGQADLGLFTSSAFTWGGRISRWQLADSFESAADQAVEQIFDRVAGTERVPGMPAPKR